MHTVTSVVKRNSGIVVDNHPDRTDDVGMHDDEILTRQALAQRLGISEEALAQMATRGTGPRYVKLSGRLVRYRMSDVNAWLEANLVTSTKATKGG